MANVPLVNLYQTRIIYAFSGLTHGLTLWSIAEDFSAAPGGTPDEYGVIPRSAVAVPWDDAVDALLAQFRKQFANTTLFTAAELWKFAAGSEDAEFLSAYEIAVAGSNVAANVIASETIHTSRTSSGRILKVYAEETVGASSTPSSWSALDGGNPYQELGFYWLGSSMAFVDREGAFPIALLKYSIGQNEAIFRRRYRPS